MLVLTRKVGEQIVIAGNIEVTVVQIQGSKVRLGVTAPRKVSIHRLEVRRRIDAELQGVSQVVGVQGELEMAASRSTPN